MFQVRLFQAVFVAFALLFSSFSMAVEMWQKGVHYKELPFPVKTRDASKVEVVEVFWYGCPHCYEFNNDHLHKWEESFTEDIDFRLVPATFPGWVTHAEIYYAAEELGKVAELHQPLFDAIQSSPRKYKNRDDFIALFGKHGVSEDEFNGVFKASGFRKISKVQEKVDKTNALIKAYRLTGVPALIINGKYKIGVREAGGFANMVKVANFLIAKERHAMKGAAQ